MINRENLFDTFTEPFRFILLNDSIPLSLTYRSSVFREVCEEPVWQRAVRATRLSQKCERTMCQVPNVNAQRVVRASFPGGRASVRRGERRTGLPGLFSAYFPVLCKRERERDGRAGFSRGAICAINRTGDDVIEHHRRTAQNIAATVVHIACTCREG